MEEKTEIIPDKANTTTTSNEILIPVKFNKEVRNLTLEEATLLSQKGMKFDAIEKQWERIKAFAKEDNFTTSQFLDALENMRTEKRMKELTDQCGGNSEMAKKFLLLEKKEPNLASGEKDFKEYFPDKEISDLPEEVLNRAKQNNSNILDEYLRFRARKDAEEEKQKQKLKENAESAVGSQKDSGINRSPEQAEFVRGIWNK